MMMRHASNMYLCMLRCDGAIVRDEGLASQKKQQGHTVLQSPALIGVDGCFFCVLLFSFVFFSFVFFSSLLLSSLFSSLLFTSLYFSLPLDFDD